MDDLYELEFILMQSNRWQLLRPEKEPHVFRVTKILLNLGGNYLYRLSSRSDLQIPFALEDR